MTNGEVLESYSTYHKMCALRLVTIGSSLRIWMKNPKQFDIALVETTNFQQKHQHMHKDVPSWSLPPGQGHVP